MHDVRIENRRYLCFGAGELRLVVRKSGGIVELQARDKATALALHALSTGAIRVPNSAAVELRVAIDDGPAVE